MENFSLVIPTFIAGLFTFLAPCTFPLVPGYLSFISGVSLEDLKDPEKQSLARKKIFFNGVMYVLGFSAVFILLGVLFGLGGAALAQHRIWLARVGGVFVIFFGLYMMHVLKLPFLNFLSSEKKLKLPASLTPGKPSSSFIFGSTFAFGWSPCVGPILGSVLVLSSSSATVIEGGLLLAVFSLGLALPFLLIALGVGRATKFVQKFSKYLNIVSFIGGIFLVILGVLLLTDNFGRWISYFYIWFDFLSVERIYDFL